MSQTILQFIDGTVATEIPNLASSSPYLGAAIIAGGIEFLGACLDAADISDDGLSAARFCLALNELFPADYRQYSRVAPYTKHQKPTHDLYSALRCGMAHVLRPQGVSLTTSVEASALGLTHLQLVTRGSVSQPLIVVDQFITDYRSAVTELKRRIEASPLPTKLQGTFLPVWTPT